jgi:hypothetical protein
MKVHRIKHDVQGAKYDELLARLLQTQHSFSLVWRDQLSFESSASKYGEDLQHLEIERVKARRWPGTRLIGHSATVVHYRVASEAAEVLRGPGSLYSWVAPAFPEDLAFYGPSKECSLVTVSHEAEGWVLSKSLVSELAQLVTFELEDISEDNNSILLGSA